VTSSADDAPPPDGERDARTVSEEFGALYDEATLAAIEAWAQARVTGTARRVPGDGPDAVLLDPVGRRNPRTMGTGGAMLAAALFGLADALEAEPAKPDVVEYAPDDAGTGVRAATFVFVPGSPEASRIIVRTWLLGDDARLAAPRPEADEPSWDEPSSG